ncbi:heterokaryon incompatibility protein-domain-containing protein [Trametes polyzona]|nr:heterokaryon incompatibility protein-domain-containing protein [Trametes polyzona]
MPTPIRLQRTFKPYGFLTLPSACHAYLPSPVCPDCENSPSAMLAMFSPLFRRRLGIAYDGCAYQYGYTTSWKQLKGSRCSWCSLLFKLLFPEWKKVLKGDIEDAMQAPMEVHAVLNIGFYQFSIWLTPLDAEHMRRSYDIGVYTYAAAAYFPAQPRIVDRGSADALARARACIDHCVRKHRVCRELAMSARSPHLPTRLIDCSDPNRPRLVRGTSVDANSTYLALSYVWGGDQPHRTTRANLSEYSRGIDSSLLPHTIRDAIHVTHGLGHRYLWVDSLCILQDSKEDKHCEMAQMLHIYRSAHVTIIASSSDKATDGFLHDPGPPISALQPLPFACPRRSRGPRRRPREDGTIHIALKKWQDLKDDHFETQPVNARAWCLQESLMSLRVLFFGKKSFCFRCPTHHKRVSGSPVDPPDTDPRQLPTMFLRGSNLARMSGPWPLLRDVRAYFTPRKWKVATYWSLWREVVEDYSGRRITYPSDKLVACAAIAEVFHRLWGSDYLAGLWRETLLWDLLWSMDEHVGASALAAPGLNRAPSWSWAGVDLKVKSRASDMSPIPMAEVVACDIALDDPELPFGGVSRGTLTLRATLIRCAWAPLHEGMEPQNGYWGLSAVLLETAQQAQRRIDSASDLTATEEALGDEQHRGRGQLDRKADYGVQHLWAALIFRADPKQSWCEVRGLVLSSTSDDESYGWNIQSLLSPVEFMVA